MILNYGEKKIQIICFQKLSLLAGYIIKFKLILILKLITHTQINIDLKFYQMIIQNALIGSMQK